MTVLITMAGMGSRFSSAGYTVPKYRIQALGRTLFDWSLRSLLAFRSEPLILATLQDEDEAWLTDAARQLGFRDVRIHGRSGLSRGQAETAYDALWLADAQSALWVYNIDTHVAKGMQPTDLGAAAGCIHVFPSDNPGMSFVSYGVDDHHVERVVEKQVISRWATVGMYGFSSAELFAHYYREAYEAGRAPLVRGERYIAPIFQVMLDEQLPLVAPRLDAADVKILGTPAELLAFDQAAVAPIGNPA